jgi:hypothetical protein
VNKAMWEITEDHGTYDLTVNGDPTNVNRGKFYLNAKDGDIGEVDALLDQALGYQSIYTIYTEANFLIPLTVGGPFDIGKQPFVQPMPEPGTFLLFGSGLTGLSLVGWRKLARAKRQAPFRNTPCHPFRGDGTSPVFLGRFLQSRFSRGTWVRTGRHNRGNDAAN